LVVVRVKVPSLLILPEPGWGYLNKTQRYRLAINKHNAGYLDNSWTGIASREKN
jgi:hypothetical protein